MVHFHKSYMVMQEIFDHRDFKTLLSDLQQCAAAGVALGQTAAMRFLDLGCAPGGFSACLLQDEMFGSTSVGFGVSLPPHMGGFSMGFASDRHFVQFEDIMLLESSRMACIDDSVHLAVADAQNLELFWKRTNPTARYRGLKTRSQSLGIWALTVKQCKLSFAKLRHKGSFIFRFGWRGIEEHVHPSGEEVSPDLLSKYQQEEEWYKALTYWLFSVLKSLFSSLRPFKSEYCHQADVSFYMVCHQFDRKKYEAFDWEAKLQRTFDELTECLDEGVLVKELSDALSASIKEEIDSLLSLVGRMRAIGINSRKVTNPKSFAAKWEDRAADKQGNTAKSQPKEAVPPADDEDGKVAAQQENESEGCPADSAQASTKDTSQAEHDLVESGSESATNVAEPKDTEAARQDEKWERHRQMDWERQRRHAQRQPAVVYTLINGQVVPVDASVIAAMEQDIHTKQMPQAAAGASASFEAASSSELQESWAQPADYHASAEEDSFGQSEPAFLSDQYRFHMGDHFQFQQYTTTEEGYPVGDAMPWQHAEAAWGMAGEHAVDPSVMQVMGTMPWHTPTVPATSEELPPPPPEPPRLPAAAEDARESAEFEPPENTPLLPNELMARIAANAKGPPRDLSSVSIATTVSEPAVASSAKRQPVQAPPRGASENVIQPAETFNSSDEDAGGKQRHKRRAGRLVRERRQGRKARNSALVSASTSAGGPSLKTRLRTIWRDMALSLEGDMLEAVRFGLVCAMAWMLLSIAISVLRMFSRQATGS